MTASTKNPQQGELVELKSQPEVKWIVLDFFPWGFGGKHAWTLFNPEDGTRKIVLRGEIQRVEEK